MSDTDERETSSAGPKKAPDPEVTSSAASKSIPELDMALPTDWSGTSEARQELHERIERDFRYHAPTGPEQTLRYQRIRARARVYAHELVELVPPSRELSQALSALELVVFHANAGVARNE